MDRFNANLVIAACYALAAISLFCIGETAENMGLLVPIVLVSGVLVNTAQASMNALAAGFYPTEGRGTGVASMLGMARFGGIAGSFLVAGLVRWHFTLVGVFATIAVAGVLSCIALLVKQFAPPRVFSTAPEAVRC
jgi:AAHS family 4-hydroxybenzoate transporter-like MFS transporter